MKLLQYIKVHPLKTSV